MEETIRNINKLDRIFPKELADNIEFVKSLVDKDIELSYLNRKISTSFDKAWFMHMVEFGAFDFQRIPGPKTFENNGTLSKGYSNWEGAFPIMTASNFALKNSDQELFDVLRRIIKDYIEFSYFNKANPDRNFIPDHHFSIFILQLPLKWIDDMMIAFIKDFGLVTDKLLISAKLTEDFFKRLIYEKNQKLIFFFLDLFFTPINTENFFKMGARIDEYHLKNFEEEHHRALHELFDGKMTSWSIDKLTSLAEEHPSYFQKFNIVSLEDDIQNNDSDGINFTLVKFVIDLIELEEKDSKITIVEHMLRSNVDINKRIGFYFVDKYFGKFSDLFWKQEGNPLTISESKLEIFRLINRHVSEFSSEEVEKVLGWIGNFKVQNEDNQSQEDAERYESYLKTEWFQALEPAAEKFPKIAELYQKATSISEGNVKSHPGYDSYFSFKSGGDVSEERINELDEPELMTFLADQQLWNGYNKYGLDQDFGQYVIVRKSRVLKNPWSYKNLPISFLYKFSDSLRALAEKSKSDDWVALLDFVYQYIQNPELYVFADEGNGERESAIGMVAWFIRSLSENTNREMSEEEIMLGVAILIRMDNEYTAVYERTDDDQFHVVNSTRGKIYDGMIKLSLRYAKTSTADQRWIPEIKNQFTHRLKQAEFYEFFWICGMNTPPISYLDMQWIQESHKQLFSDNDNGNAAFSAYLLFSRQVYADLFGLLNDEYLRRIATFKKPSTVTNMLIAHIISAFLNDMSGAEAMVECVFEQADIDQLSYVIKAVNFEPGNLDPKKLIAIWSRLVELAESGEGLTNLNISETLRFIDHLAQIDETSEKLFLKTIHLADQNTRTYSLVGVLSKKIKSNFAGRGGRMLLALLTKIDGFSLDEEKINEIISVLYQQNEMHTADSLVAEMLKKRNFSVVQIYNQYHTQGQE